MFCSTSKNTHPSVTLFLPHRAMWNFLTLVFAQDWKKHIGQNFIGIWTTASPVISVSSNNYVSLFILTGPRRAVSLVTKLCRTDRRFSQHECVENKNTFPGLPVICVVWWGKMNEWYQMCEDRVQLKGVFFRGLLGRSLGMSMGQATRSSRGKTPGNSSGLGLSWVLLSFMTERSLSLWQSLPLEHYEIIDNCVVKLHFILEKLMSNHVL